MAAATETPITCFIQDWMMIRVGLGKICRTHLLMLSFIVWGRAGRHAGK